MINFLKSIFLKNYFKMDSVAPLLYPTPISFKSQPVPVTYQTPIEESAVKLALAGVPFQEWLKQLETQQNLNLKSILIQNIDMFGPRVGFIKFKGEVTKTVITEQVDLNGVKSLLREEKQIPNIVFMRGGSVAILVVLITPKNRKYTLLTRQARFPIGFDHFPEIPAGMLDGNGDFKGVAAKEMEEETGIHIKDSDLIDLSGWAFGGRKGIYLSPGGCDEFIRIFALEKNVEEAWIEELRGKRTGEEGTDEVIVLDVIELEKMGRVCNDGKSLVAVMLYESYLKEKSGEA